MCGSLHLIASIHSFINYFIGFYSVPVIKQRKPDKISGFVRHICHMTSQPPSKQGHPVSTGSTAVKDTGFGVRYTRVLSSSVTY